MAETKTAYNRIVRVNQVSIRMNFTLTDASGRTLAVKGDTHKQKTTSTEYRERDDGSIAETRILTDKFVPVIRAWDLSPDSATLGRIITIH